MIFGFNTDIKQGGTVYHVQSEARTQDLLLQTQVFVRGRCIGKRAVSYAGKVLQPGFSDEQMHEMLKTQHRNVLDAVREDRVESMVSQANIIEDVEGQGLAVQWTNTDDLPQANSMTLRLLVTDGGVGVAGARLTTRISIAPDAPIHAQAETDAAGVAELPVMLDDSAAPESAVLVQASHKGKSATRKFRVRRSG